MKDQLNRYNFCSSFPDMHAIKEDRSGSKEPATALIRKLPIPADGRGRELPNDSLLQSPPANEVHARSNKDLHYGRGYSNDGPHGSYEGL
ncbi:MAG TPA: hypothetical protein VGD26_05250 [Chitinophagaceae bacterium]